MWLYKGGGYILFSEKRMTYVAIWSRQQLRHRCDQGVYEF
jgi:hypothetical protein